MQTVCHRVLLITVLLVHKEMFGAIIERKAYGDFYDGKSCSNSGTFIVEDSHNIKCVTNYFETGIYCILLYTIFFTYISWFTDGTKKLP